MKFLTDYEIESLKKTYNVDAQVEIRESFKPYTIHLELNYSCGYIRLSKQEKKDMLYINRVDFAENIKNGITFLERLMEVIE